MAPPEEVPAPEVAPAEVEPPEVEPEDVEPPSVLDPLVVLPLVVEPVVSVPPDVSPPVVPESVLPESVEPEVVPPVAAPEVVELPEVELLEEFDVERRLVREPDDDEEDEDESSSSFDEPGREPSLLQRYRWILSGSTVSPSLTFGTDAPHPLSNSLVYLMNSPERFSGQGAKSVLSTVDSYRCMKSCQISAGYVPPVTLMPRTLVIGMSSSGAPIHTAVDK